MIIAPCHGFVNAPPVHNGCPLRSAALILTYLLPRLGFLGIIISFDDCGVVDMRVVPAPKLHSVDSCKAYAVELFVGDRH